MGYTNPVFVAGAGGYVQVTVQTLTVQTLTNGTGYNPNFPPVVTLSGGGGIGVGGVAIVVGTTVATLVINGAPLSFTTAPTVTIATTSGTGTGAGAVLALTTTITTLNNIDWSYEEKARLYETTNAASGAVPATAAADYNGSDAIKEYAGKTSVMWDSTAEPESVGLVAGAHITILTAYGSSGKQKTMNAAVETIAPKDNTRQDGITYDLSWKGKGPINYT